MVHLCSMLEFEVDPRRSATNKARHGIDFVEARHSGRTPAAWRSQPARRGRRRALVIGQSHGQPWAAVITYRGARIRLISVRRAREKEVALYESQEAPDHPGEGI